MHNDNRPTVSSVIGVPGVALSDPVLTDGSCEFEADFCNAAIACVVGIGAPMINFLFALGDVMSCCGVVVSALGAKDSGLTRLGDDLEEIIEPGSGKWDAGRSEEIDCRFFGCVVKKNQNQYALHVDNGTVLNSEVRPDDPVFLALAANSAASFASCG